MATNRHGVNGMRSGAAAARPALEPPALHPMRRQTLPLEIANVLRERILNGEFRDAEVLRQEALAAEYGVSRVPLREALRLLEGEGFLTIHAHRGAVVTVLSEAQIGELYDLRAILEKDLVVRAIPNALPDDVVRAEKILGELDEAFAGGAVASWGVLNADFHRTLYLPSGRERTLAIVQSINALTERYLRLQLTLTRDFERAQGDHREILRLYRQRKAKPCGAFIEQHILHAKEKLTEAMRARSAGAK